MKVLLVLLPVLSLSSGKLFGSCGTLSKDCATDTTPVSSEEYLLLSAAEKNTIIWDNCKQDTSSAQWFSSLELVGLFKESMCPTFKTKGDELPWEKDFVFYGWRKKYIHTVGTVGKVEWKNLGGHPYTGLFEGATQGIVRFSLAKEPSAETNATAPGLGLKLLRDGMDSANLVAMYSVDGQDSWNFFKNNFTNHIAPAGLGLVPIALKFSQATNYVQQVALSDFAKYGETGTPVAEPNFPYMLTFQPTGEFTFPDDYVRPFTEDLTSIPSGSTLYKVVALDQPTEIGGTEKHIADLVLVSDMVTSLWGDKQLFFRHQDMVEDIALKPEWEEYLDTFGLKTAGCPAQRMMQAGKLGDN